MTAICKKNKNSAFTSGFYQKHPLGKMDLLKDLGVCLMIAAKKTVVNLVTRLRTTKITTVIMDSITIINPGMPA